MRVLYFIGAVAVLLALPVTFNQCSDVSFSPNTVTQASITTNGDGSKTYEAGHMFSESQTRPLDIVWIIDNSGSMSTEAAHVRANLASFVNTIASAADVKLALISAIGSTGTMVDYPDISVPNLKINQSVGSTNGLRLLSSALCPPGSTHALCTSAAEASVRGQLLQFLRKDSHKAFVMVTDDETSIAHTDFLDVYTSSFDKSTLTFSGWIGHGQNLSPCQAATGARYMTLAQETGGQVYNVCDSDWSAKFAQLANNVVTLIQDTIGLPSEVISGQIISVSLNGQPIAPVDYQITANGITFSAAIRQMYQSQVTLRIEFR